MKTYLFLLVLHVVALTGYAQSPEIKNLTPARGHYLQLQQFNPAPAQKDAEVDKQKFPFDAQAAEKRLSLKPYYLKDNIKFHIPDPPANSSAQTRAELNYLLSLQNQRTLEQERASLYVAGVYYNPRVMPADSTYSRYRKNLFHIGRSIGTWFTPETLPLTADFMAHVWQDASYYIWKYKYQFLRVRPYVLEPELQNLEETNWAAYPSGHAANSYVNAYVYSELAPHFADVFLKDAYDMAHSREIIGVHYPSDSEASRVLARQLVNELFQNEKFLKDFESVKQEWAAHAKETFEKPAQSRPKPVEKKEGCAKTCEQ
ncbi:MAG: phosphatase [Cyclobacteriaceae bacterium]|nr:phosphatase [Cyclobacteriaceae bacterium]